MIARRNWTRDLDPQACKLAREPETAQLCRVLYFYKMLKVLNAVILLALVADLGQGEENCVVQTSGEKKDLCYCEGDGFAINITDYLTFP